MCLEGLTLLQWMEDIASSNSVETSTFKAMFTLSFLGKDTLEFNQIYSKPETSCLKFREYF